MTFYKYFLTFDVGIKNLAYCLCRYEKNKSILEGLEILDWNILDVSYKPLVCKHIKNKRKICNTNSVYYSLKENIINNQASHRNADNLIGYCQHHANELKERNKIAHKNLFRVSKNKLFINNFNVQMERLLKSLENFFQNKLQQLYHTDEPMLEAETFKEFVISNLDIYIENQPVFKNPIMKTISIGIFTFFTLKKVILPNIINSVNFISASDKTHLAFINTMKESLKIKPKTDVNFKIYAERKEFAIDITNQVICNLKKSIFNIVSTVNYELMTKKDDMADTLIYVLVLLLKNK
jgi:hypothetical protein